LALLVDWRGCFPQAAGDGAIAFRWPSL
jgi:hypothetical protein